MKLNPSKCAFRVASRKFLGCMVSQRGIEANPEKVWVILDKTSPKTIKEVQKLTRKIVALNRFVSRATDKCLPFFKTLKQAFTWTDECKIAFQELKCYLSNPPLLSPSKGGGGEACICIWQYQPQPWVQPWFRKTTRNSSLSTMLAKLSKGQKPSTWGLRRWHSY